MTTPQYYSEMDAAILARRKHVQDMIVTINGETEFCLRGRADEGKGIQELHLDFETAYYKVWITFYRTGVTRIYRDAKDAYHRRRWTMYVVEYPTLQRILSTLQ